MVRWLRFAVIMVIMTDSAPGDGASTLLALQLPPEFVTHLAMPVTQRTHSVAPGSRA
jgi:hypothetical protein